MHEIRGSTGLYFQFQIDASFGFVLRADQLAATILLMNNCVAVKWIHFPSAQCELFAKTCWSFYNKCLSHKAT